MKRATAKAKAGPRMGGDLFVHPGANTFTGKVDKTVNRRLAALPFTRSGGGRCWWHVKPSGNYSADYARGAAWARKVLPLLKYNVGAPLLSWIIVDMIKAGDRNGVVLGFVREIGDQLKATRSNLLFAVAATDRKAPASVRKLWSDGRKKIAETVAGAL